MKKSILVLVAVIVAFTVTSCKSKEEKAAELIKQELSQVLYDFESYDPIVTLVTEAKDIPTNNYNCILKANTAVERSEWVDEHLKDVTSARKRMNYWGPPTRYSSSYSDSKYYENKSDYVCAMKIANIYINSYNSAIDDLDTMMKNMKNTNPSETIGYNVEHGFRCRTKGGLWTIAHYRFVTDKKFKRIIFIDETGDATDLIKSAQNGCGKIDTLDWKKYTK